MTGADGAGRNRVVTIDGPAGSGKSTTAREVARRLDFFHLDSGALYRALTLALLRQEIPEDAWEALEPDALSGVDVRLDPRGRHLAVLLDGVDPGEELRSRSVTRLVPQLARVGPARQRLLELQRSAPSFGGVVADGRDMGTVIFPDARFKFFLTASLQERARRRLLQEGRAADPRALEEEVEWIRERDKSDADRALAPLRRPADAEEIDTTALTFEDQVDRILRTVRRGPGAADSLD